MTSDFASDSEATALKELFAAIASRDRTTAARMIRQLPALARRAAVVGATRAEANAYFFEQIAHYAYGGDTALHMAAAAYELEIAGELIAKGADVRARNRRGAEPLHYATDGIPGSSSWAPDAQAAVIELLHKAGAEPNAADDSGVAPLHRAVRTRCAAAVRTLLAHGADVCLRNKSGSTALHLAVQNTGRGGSGNPDARTQQAEIIRLLLAHGARPSDEDAAGRAVRDFVKADWIRTLFEDT